MNEDRLLKRLTTKIKERRRDIAEIPFGLAASAEDANLGIAGLVRELYWIFKDENARPYYELSFDAASMCYGVILHRSCGTRHIALVSDKTGGETIVKELNLLLDKLDPQHDL